MVNKVLDIKIVLSISQILDKNCVYGGHSLLKISVHCRQNRLWKNEAGARNQVKETKNSTMGTLGKHLAT